MNQITPFQAIEQMHDLQAPPDYLPDTLPTAAEVGPADGFGKRLAGARRFAKLTPAKLAKRVGLTTAEIKDIETDGAWCPLDQVRGFAAALDADLLWLWLGREPQTASAIQAPAADDTALIALCDRLLANMDALDADPNDIEPGDVRWDEMLRQREAIRHIAPTSFAGHQRRAAAYLRASGGVGADGEPASHLDGRSMWPILRDLANAATDLSPGSAAAQVVPHLADDQRLLAIDAEAVSLLQQWQELSARWVASPNSDSPDYTEADRQAVHALSKEMDVPYERLEALNNESILLKATCLQAARAKARICLFWMRVEHERGGVVDLEELDNCDRLLWSLLDDIVTVAVPDKPGQIDPVSAHPDAELIALCARHDALLDEANEVGRSEPDLDQQVGRLVDASEGVMKTITSTMRATTPTGLAAFAHTAARWADGMIVTNEDAPIEMLLRDSLALAGPTPSATPVIASQQPSPEITNAIAVVDAAQSVMSDVFTRRAEDEEFDAAADIEGRAIDACGAVRIATMADASAIARIALRYMADGDIAGSADEVVLGLLKSLAQHVPEAANPDADIIAQCDQTAAAWTEYFRLSDEQDMLPKSQQAAFDDTAMTPAYLRAFEAFDAIQKGPMPQTPEGLRGMARAAIFQKSDTRPEDPSVVEVCDVADELAWKLLGHLAGLGVQYDRGNA